MSVIKTDKNGRKYEYRQELSKLANQEVEATLFDIKFVRAGARLQILSQDVELDGKIVCKHAFCNMKSSLIKKIGKKSINVKNGQSIRVLANVVEYVNKKGQKNYSLRINNIL